MSVVELEARDVAIETPSMGLWSDAWFRLRRNPAAIVGFCVIVVLVIVAIFAPLLAPFGPRDQNLSLLRQGCCPGLSHDHLFGVDELGRDELSRIIFGARFSLLIGVVSVSVGFFFGSILGAISGFFGGWIDTAIMRLVDIWLTIPGFLMAIGIVAVLGPGLTQIMIAIGVINVPLFARLLRGSVLAQRENDFVLAARSVGERDLLKLSDDKLRRIRGREIAMIFQDPMTSLNPVLTVGRQIREALETHFGMAKEQAMRRAADLLDQVGIPSAEVRLKDYPHQFSGGMRQRAMIAMALACEPKLLIADEPTTALDVTIQAQILDLLRELVAERDTALILITHDLGVVAGMCERVNVMYAGMFMETGSASQLFDRPRHPYTLGLLQSIPRLDATRKEALKPIEGAPRDMLRPPSACPFQPRCRYEVEQSRLEVPPLLEIEPGHKVACFNPVPAEEWERTRAAATA